MQTITAHLMNLRTPQTSYSNACVLVFSHKTVPAGPLLSAGAVLLFKALTKLLCLTVSHQLMVDLVCIDTLLLL